MGIERDNQNSPDPMKPRPEEIKQLAESAQYNPGLAKRVAEDARRLVAGKLTESEFYQKYHQSYIKEFGIDNRPLDAGNISRRTFLKLAGGSVITLVIGPPLLHKISLNNIDEPKSAAVRQVQLGMVIDLERCTGCLTCVDACKRENNLELGANWMYVFAYKDAMQDGSNILVRPCQHCANPPCVKVCPTLARHKRKKDGLVLTDYDVCIGTRYCEAACPFGVNYFGWGKPNPDEGYRFKRTDYRGIKVNGNPPRGVMGKCVFCADRQDSETKKGTTACQLACTTGSIIFGDMNDPNSPPISYLRERKKENAGKLSAFRLLEDLGTKPSIIYIGNSPSRLAKQVPGPVSYEAWGMVDERRAVLEGPQAWFKRVFGG